MTWLYACGGASVHADDNRGEVAHGGVVGVAIGELVKPDEPRRRLVTNGAVQIDRNRSALRRCRRQGRRVDSQRVVLKIGVERVLVVAQHVDVQRLVVDGQDQLGKVLRIVNRDWGIGVGPLRRRR